MNPRTETKPTVAAHGPRILLVEDEPSIAEPFLNALGRSGFPSELARTGAEALARSGEEEFAAILLDLGLPDIDGRDVCRQIRARSEVPIIVVSARDSVTDRVVGLELGADDYIVKPFAIQEVVARIRSVLRRRPPAATASTEHGRLQVQDLCLDPRARRAWRGSEELALTRREYDLLLRLVEDAGRVLSREQLMADVWDENWFGSTKTLDVHIGGLRRKLGDDPEAQAYIRTVRGVGFAFVSGAEPGPDERR